MPVALKSSGKTIVGSVRTTNEDSLHLDPEGGIFIVADGMGGVAGGEVASRLACEKIAKEFLLSPHLSAEKRLRDAITAANKAILEMANEDSQLKGMGTTVTALIIDGDYALIGHVGDSRIYRLRGGQIKQLSVDHTVLQEVLSKGVISPAEAKKIERGEKEFDYRNVITRAVGTEEIVEVDLRRELLEDGDCFLLCSDGLTSVVEDDEIQNILAKTDGNLETACSRLTTLAIEKGSQDNVTVLAVEVAVETAIPATKVYETVTRKVVVPTERELEFAPERRVSVLRAHKSWVIFALVICISGSAAFFALRNGRVREGRSRVSDPRLASAFHLLPGDPAGSLVQFRDLAKLSPPTEYQGRLARKGIILAYLKANKREEALLSLEETLRVSTAQGELFLDVDQESLGQELNTKLGNLSFALWQSSREKANQGITNLVKESPEWVEQQVVDGLRSQVAGLDERFTAGEHDAAFARLFSLQRKIVGTKQETDLRKAKAQVQAQEKAKAKAKAQAQETLSAAEAGVDRLKGLGIEKASPKLRGMLEEAEIELSQARVLWEKGDFSGTETRGLEVVNLVKAIQDAHKEKKVGVEALLSEARTEVGDLKELSGRASPGVTGIIKEAEAELIKAGASLKTGAFPEAEERSRAAIDLARVARETYNLEKQKIVAERARVARERELEKALQREATKAVAAAGKELARLKEDRDRIYNESLLEKVREYQQVAGLELAAGRFDSAMERVSKANALLDRLVKESKPRPLQPAAWAISLANIIDREILPEMKEAKGSLQELDRLSHRYNEKRQEITGQLKGQISPLFDRAKRMDGCSEPVRDWLQLSWRYSGMARGESNAGKLKKSATELSWLSESLRRGGEIYYLVQVGAFRHRARADDIYNRSRKAGYENVRVIEDWSTPHTPFKVMIFSYSTRKEAERIAEEVKDKLALHRNPPSQQPFIRPFGQQFEEGE